MAGTFAKPTFSSASYASFRPTYPEKLYSEHLLPYHRGPRNLLIDLGCGPGTVTRPLSLHFTRAVGTDPSPSMLETARSLTPASTYPHISYAVATAEDLSPVAGAGEVDMVVAAQAAHWFTQPAWWEEMARVVRPRGTVAVWGYRDMLVPARPRASAVISRYMNGPDKLGPYWTLPGRGIVEQRYRAIRPPQDTWEDVRRWEYEPKFTVEASKEQEAVRRPVLPDDGLPGFGELVHTDEGMLERTMPLGDVVGYVRTWSCVHAWEEKHGRNRKNEGGTGDIVDECFEEVARVEGLGDGWEKVEVEVKWGHGLVMARRRADA